MKKLKFSKVPQNTATYYMLAYPKIIETIRLAAAPYADQIDVMSKHNIYTEDVELFVEHACMMSKIINQNGFITNEQYNSIKELHKKFDDFLDSEWETDSMEYSDNWNELRILGKKALDEFSVQYARANIYWVFDIY